MQPVRFYIFAFNQGSTLPLISTVSSLHASTCFMSTWLFIWWLLPVSEQGIRNTSPEVLIQGSVGGRNFAWSGFFACSSCLWTDRQVWEGEEGWEGERKREERRGQLFRSLSHHCVTPLFEVVSLDSRNIHIWNETLKYSLKHIQMVFGWFVILNYSWLCPPSLL